MNITKDSVTIQENGYIDENFLFTYSEDEKQQNAINEDNASHIFNPEFIPFYTDVRDKYKLSDIETLLYGFIRFYLKNGRKRFWWTNEQLSDLLNASTVTISKAINRLASIGIINPKYKIKSGGGKIRFIDDIKLSDVPTLKNLTSDIKKFNENKNKINKNKINKNKINNIGNIFLSLQGINVPTTEEHITSANEYKNSPIKTKKTKYDRNWLDQFIVSNDMAEAEVIASLPSLKDKITAQEIMNIARKMPSWCDAKGKTYTNWRAALINWSEIEIQRQTEKIEAYKKEMRAKGAFFMEDL